MKKIALLLIGIALLITATSANALSVGTWGNWATIGTQFNDSFAGYLGYSYDGAAATNWLLVKVDMNLAKIKDVQTKAGLAYWATSPNNNGSSLGLTWGASVMVLPNVSIGGDIILASYNTSTGGTNSTDILPAGEMSFNLYF